MSGRYFYLGKRGKVTGPISEGELEALRHSAEIENYTYLWDSEKSTWTAIEAPPPPPTAIRSAAASPKPSWASINAICHNFNRIISGQIENISDSGCDLISTEEEGSPSLGVGTALVINLVDPIKNRAMNVSASLTSISRCGEEWVYHLSWPHRPNL